MRSIRHAFASLPLFFMIALPVSAGPGRSDKIRATQGSPRSQIVSCEFKYITGYFLVGSIWSTGCQQAWRLESNFDKPVGSELMICPNQHLPAGWVILNIVGLPIGCPADSPQRGSYWLVRRHI